jgi:hypothetical protein
MTPVVPGLVIFEKDPLRPKIGREVFAVSNPITVRGWLDGRGIDEFHQPTVCLVDGVARLRAEWPLIEIGPGNEVRFVTLPYQGGGGGGGGGKSPLKVVLSIAIMAVSIVAAPSAWSAMR